MCYNIGDISNNYESNLKNIIVCYALNIRKQIAIR